MLDLETMEKLLQDLAIQGANGAVSREEAHVLYAAFQASAVICIAQSLEGIREALEEIAAWNKKA